MAPHSITLAWKIPWMEKPGRLQSMGSLRVGHDWATSLSLFTFIHWRRKCIIFTDLSLSPSLCTPTNIPPTAELPIFLSRTFLRLLSHLIVSLWHCHGPPGSSIYRYLLFHLICFFSFWHLWKICSVSSTIWLGSERPGWGLPTVSRDWRPSTVIATYLPASKGWACPLTGSILPP